MFIGASFTLVLLAGDFNLMFHGARKVLGEMILFDLEITWNICFPAEWLNPAMREEVVQIEDAAQEKKKQIWNHQIAMTPGINVI